MPIISPTAISPHRIGKAGINWSSYLATLISATVETAAPTNVVLTFPAPADIDETDFSIPGFTFASGSWAGAVLTLVLSSPVLAYHGNLTITFTKTGTTATVTNNVAMANTVGWFVSGDGSATYVTKDGSNFVSVWKDLSGSNNVLQATGTNQPLWEADGILFDGVDNFLKSAAFTYNQPEFVYLVLKQVTWTLNDIIVDGNNNLMGTLRQRATTPGLMIYVTAYTNQNDGLAVDTWGIVRYLINGANSKITINGNAPVTGNVGAGNMGGITLCKRGGDNDFFGHAKIAEAIFRNAADDATTEAAIYAYLKNKYSL